MLTSFDMGNRFEDTFLTKEYSTKQWETRQATTTQIYMPIMIHFSIYINIILCRVYIQKQKINKHSFSHKANLQ